MTVTAIQHATIHRISKPVLEKGTVVIKGSKIAAVGAKTRIPKGARVIDGRGKHVCPGFVEPHCHLGTNGEGLGPRHNDGNEPLDPIQPHIRVLDAIWADDPSFAEVLGAGVTTTWITPGSDNVFCGQGVAIKTRPGIVDDRVLEGTTGMKMALGENVTRVHQNQTRYPDSRMGVTALGRQWLTRARRAASRLGKKTPGPDFDFRLEALLPLIRGEMKARVHAHRADDIITAMRLADEFGLDLVIEHCTEGFLVCDILAERGIPAVIGPHMTGRGKPETSRRHLGNATILHEAGVKIALQTDGNSTVQFLPVNAALAVREGLPYEAALQAITLNAAEIIGIGHRVGSIEPGKDADVLLMQSDPLDIRFKPEIVFCEGVPFYPV